MESRNWKIPKKIDQRPWGTQENRPENQLENLVFTSEAQAPLSPFPWIWDLISFQSGGYMFRFTTYESKKACESQHKFRPVRQAARLRPSSRAPLPFELNRLGCDWPAPQLQECWSCLKRWIYNVEGSRWPQCSLGNPLIEAPLQLSSGLLRSSRYWVL